MFKKILIANRGEVAIRIIRACKELRITCVAVYSEADKNSFHVRLADEAICIGPANPQKSYLNIQALISAAEVVGADAIHPGYGFLSENADFSQICVDHNITFIGASPQNIRLMGNKSEAKKIMTKFGIPVIPGSSGVVKSIKDIKKIAEDMEFPLMIKASSGGGGKGMRIVHEPEKIEAMFNIATNEAQASFNDSDVYIEKYLENPRHIEVQILSDKFGNAVHLGERDCSVQRRHQKLIEESPSPFITEKLRIKMGQAAIQAAQAIKYQGAGTVEFLVDKNHNFYFMEMNTRLQVEHPVTEMVTSLDLVKEQIVIASTNKLGLKQKDITFTGHAIEMRINAEDHENNFMPCPGEISVFFPPGGPGVRVDTHIYPGYSVPNHYDSLLGKLIVWGKDRSEAINRAHRSLNEFIIDGVKTTIPFHIGVLEHEQFIAGDFDTHFIEKHLLKTEVN
ncbi:acetyl-CoA carboxylase biotin carboxylase subunit [Candidatus Margulisiibacteriota bacterium]